MEVKLKRKKKTAKKKLINTRGKLCSDNDMTSCCPHNKPDDKGRYRATNEKTYIYYNNNKYNLWTCCMHCSQEMNKLSKNNPKEFKKKYIHKEKNNMLILKNQHTGKVVQHAKKI